MYVLERTDELYHFGVKGMKWGIRKKEPSDVDVKKAAYKKAKRDYNKSFSKAYRRSAAALSLSKKRRAKNAERWNDAFDKAEALDSAKKEYKTAKKEARKNLTTKQKIAKGIDVAAKILKTTAGVVAIDRLFNKGRGTAAVKRGASAVADMIGKKMYNTTIIDASGKVIKRYNS